VRCTRAERQLVIVREQQLETPRYVGKSRAAFQWLIGEADAVVADSVVKLLTVAAYLDSQPAAAFLQSMPDRILDDRLQQQAIQRRRITANPSAIQRARSMATQGARVPARINPKTKVIPYVAWLYQSPASA
jgi:hypothetical protein